MVRRFSPQVRAASSIHACGLFASGDHLFSVVLATGTVIRVRVVHVVYLFRGPKSYRVDILLSAIPISRRGNDDELSGAYADRGFALGIWHAIEPCCGCSGMELLLCRNSRQHNTPVNESTIFFVCSFELIGHCSDNDCLYFGYSIHCSTFNQRPPGSPVFQPAPGILGFVRSVERQVFLCALLVHHNFLCLCWSLYGVVHAPINLYPTH